MEDVRIFDIVSVKDAIFVHSRDLFEDENVLYKVNGNDGRVNYKQAILLLLNLAS